MLYQITYLGNGLHICVLLSVPREREKDGEGEAEKERESKQEEPGEKTTIDWHIVNSGEQNSNNSYISAKLKQQIIYTR